MPTSRRLRLGACVLAATAALGGGIAVGAPAEIDIRSAAVASSRAVRTQPPTTSAPPASNHFVTLPIGATLPSDAACRAAVRPAAEVRPTNATANRTVGTSTTGRVTGAFTGTTDEIIQWAACKWGIDEDIARAQIVKESWWDQNTRAGDRTSDQSKCAPALRTGSGECPESVGLGQIRYQYHLDAFTDNNAIKSSAYNLDYTYSLWRNCFEGNETWLNTVERGKDYAAGDVWGCVGLWFSGRWYTTAATMYIADVQTILAGRDWEEFG